MQLRTVFKFMCYMGMQYQTVCIKARTLGGAQMCLRDKMAGMKSFSFVEAGDGFAANFETDL